MNRTIPGMIEVEEREFIYIDTLMGEGFDTVVDEALAGSPDLPLPKSGDVIEEKARIILLDGCTSLLALSYQGDLAGWRNKIGAYCHSTNRKWGIVSGRKVELSDGGVLVLDECNFKFDD
jgi:hypothetical protein